MRKIALFIMLTAFFGLVFLVACGDQKEAEKSETEVTSMDVKKRSKRSDGNCEKLYPAAKRRIFTADRGQIGRIRQGNGRTTVQS